MDSYIAIITAVGCDYPSLLSLAQCCKDSALALSTVVNNRSSLLLPSDILPSAENVKIWARVSRSSTPIREILLNTLQCEEVTQWLIALASFKDADLWSMCVNNENVYVKGKLLPSLEAMLALSIGDNADKTVNDGLNMVRTTLLTKKYGVDINKNRSVPLVYLLNDDACVLLILDEKASSVTTVELVGVPEDTTDYAALVAPQVTRLLS